MDRKRERAQPPGPAQGGGSMPPEAQAEAPPTWGGEGGAGDYRGGPVTSDPARPRKPR